MKIPSEPDRDPQRRQRRALTLFGLAGGAALAMALVALAPPSPDDMPAGLLLDTAPSAPASVRAAALDEGVDWSAVERAPDPAPLAVAAYAP
jgi:hypothetical protein